MSAKLIVLYGINNLGKSTQAKLLLENITSAGHKAFYAKVPFYEARPSGPIINDYLRKGNPHGLTAREIQIFYAYNRSQTEHIVANHLASGTHVVLEDYWATGICWGVARGVDRSFLEEINAYAPREDAAFLFSGKRFTDALEHGHIHETDNELTQKADSLFHELARIHKWHIIEANDPVHAVSEKIWSKVKTILQS